MDFLYSARSAAGRTEQGRREREERRRRGAIDLEEATASHYSRIEPHLDLGLCLQWRQNLFITSNL